MIKIRSINETYGIINFYLHAQLASNARLLD